MKMIFALMMLVPGGVWAEPAMRVGQADGKPLIRVVASKLAAWRPSADGLAVLMPESSGEVEIGALPKGLSAEKIRASGLAGVMLKGASGGWQVVQDGANWLVRPGAGGKSESVLLLKDGWRVSGQTYKPQTVTVAGKAWDVALVDSGISVAGSVVGAVRLSNGAKMDTFAAAPPVVPAEIPGKMAKANELPSLQPVAMPDLDEAALQPMPTRMAGPVSLTVADTRDMMVRGTFAEIEPAAGETEVAAGRASPMEVPLALKKEMAAVAPTVSGTSGLMKTVAVKPGPAMKALSVSPVADEVLPQVLGEIYLPGTIVSLTLPGDVHGGLSHELPMPAEEVAVDVSGTISDTLAGAQVSRTWNQTTLDPIAAALEAQKTSSTEPVAEVAHKEVPHAVSEEPEVAVSRLFPQKGEVYFDQLTDALQAVAAAPEDSTRAKDAQMALAQVYLIWQRPEEALAVLDELPHRADGLPASPQGRLYAAVAHVARGDVLDDKDWAKLLDLGGPLAGHGKLWKAVAASQGGDYATALKQWPEERGMLPQYPAYLRSVAQLAQANALVMVGDRAVAMKVVDELVEGYKDPAEVPVGLKRLRGLVRLGTPEENEGLEYLASAAEDMRDPAEAYRAKFQFVRALQQRRDIGDAQVLNYLSELWFDWRGDDLERDVLDTLASLYDKQNEPREALQHWQVLVKAFPKSTNMNEVTQKMTDAFLRVFDPENPKAYDLLAYVGLYYDFSELVPNDERGDLVQEQVARMLMDANLWDRAVPILEQQLAYRPLDPAAQGRLALMLAEAQGNLGNAADGLKTLDKWQKVAGTTVLSRAWKVQEAKLLLVLNRPQAAGKALANTAKDDVEALDLKVEATWAAKEWSSTIPLLQEKLAGVHASQLVSDTGAQLAAFRLSYAYGQMKDGKDLEALSKRYESSLNRLPQLADDIGAVAAGTGVSASVVATGPLAPLTGALNNINRLTDRIQNVRDTLTAERSQQKEYNDKMRYMDLLPPPAL